MTRTAVVVGAGIGGLSAAIGLRREGWDVTVLERVAAFGPVGAGLVLQANGLRCLDALGLGEAVRMRGLADASAGTRRPDGRWLARVPAGDLERPPHPEFRIDPQIRKPFLGVVRYLA
ncbi:hypothetical protein Aca07nite_38950 [Actinoplanes capillaceus]|uniref:FAD-binding domain-containing protein n=1 Tax=Actinoplanes campanulatus TaxID=113559 RepID=A0ABQ3WK87_9ACTN|nr:FAD-dependent monooxygenase [Actinoplanes capillaceus]GID46620.1 hypothetical protein Aca07nite_38950 [Actinoplanes capillaceus]